MEQVCIVYDHFQIYLASVDVALGECRGLKML